ncbi:hypothetical protein MHYP_G00045500 [Metynnis hypsauchen]
MNKLSELLGSTSSEIDKQVMVFPESRPESGCPSCSRISAPAPSQNFINRDLLLRVSLRPASHLKHPRLLPSRLLNARLQTPVQLNFSNKCL